MKLKKDGWEDFAYSIEEAFKVLFKDIHADVYIHSSAFSDPKDVNDISCVLLEPIPKLAVP